MMTTPMRIGELARQAQLNPRTLRYYECIGLLLPSARTAAGYRLYTAPDAARLAFIRRAQAIGLSLGEIGAIIALREAGTATCHHVRATAAAKVALIEERISALQALRDEMLRLAERAGAVEAACAAASTICLAFDEAGPDACAAR